MIFQVYVQEQIIWKNHCGGMLSANVTFLKSAISWAFVYPDLSYWGIDVNSAHLTEASEASLHSGSLKDLFLRKFKKYWKILYDGVHF